MSTPIIVLVSTDDADVRAILGRIVRDLPTPAELIHTSTVHAAFVAGIARSAALLVISESVPGTDVVALVSSIQATVSTVPIVLIGNRAPAIAGVTRLPDPFPYDALDIAVRAAVANEQ